LKDIDIYHYPVPYVAFQDYDPDAYWSFRHVDNGGNRYIAENIYSYPQGSA
jgi:hypothetical protein